MDRKISLLLLIFLLVWPSAIFARGEYNSLPKLDGRIDVKPLNIKPLPPASDNIEIKNIQFPKLKDTQEANSIPHEDNQKVASTTNTTDKKTPIVAIDSPKLDKLTPELKKSNVMDVARFMRYERDLNTMIEQLKHLKYAIDQGSDIQVYSAKTTTTKVLNDKFLRRYANQEESQLESFKVLQTVVSTAVYVRDYWVRSNQIQYNQHGIPDKIIQTKFLKIQTGIEELLELQKLQNVLTEE